MHHVRMFALHAACVICDAVRQFVNFGSKMGHFGENQANQTARGMVPDGEFFTKKRAAQRRLHHPINP